MYFPLFSTFIFTIRFVCTSSIYFYADIPRSKTYLSLSLFLPLKEINWKLERNTELHTCNDATARSICFSWSPSIAWWEGITPTVWSSLSGALFFYIIPLVLLLCLHQSYISFVSWKRLNRTFKLLLIVNFY